MLNHVVARTPAGKTAGLLVIFVLVLASLVPHLPEIALSISSNPIASTSGLGEPVKHRILESAPGWNDPNVGVTTQALGHLAATDILKGKLPWWNPYSGVGMPLAAEMQPSALFIPFVLLLRFQGGVIYLKICMQIIAGLSTYTLMRELGIRRRVALLGGILFEMNGTFALMGHAPIMPVPFLPLLLFGIEQALGRSCKAERGGLIWIIVAIAYSLYAGFPETAYIDGLMALSWAIARSVKLNGRERLSFFLKLCAAGVLGVLLSMPVVLPFWEFWSQGDVGLHGIVSIPLPPFNYAMLLVPYLLGPVQYDNLWMVWTNGYVSLSIAFLASLALVFPKKDVALRVMLAGWIVLSLAKSADFPILTQMADAVPFMRDIFFTRYAPASYELAAIVLAAFALNDFSHGQRWSGRVLNLAVCIWGALGVLALLCARPMMMTIAHDRPAYPDFLAGSLVAALASTALVVGLISRRPNPLRTNLLCVGLAIEAICLYAFPLLGGSPIRLDLAAVDFLKANIGLFRFYTLGPFAPNYGAYFQIASINHNYLPVPRIWTQYVKEHLDPGADPIGFVGWYPEAPPGEETRTEALARRISAYEAVGVKYVVAPHGADPFLNASRLPVAGPATAIVPLSAGQSIEGFIPAGALKDGTVAGMAVTIGTYINTSDGSLKIRLCRQQDCAEGSARLSTAADNMPVKVTFDQGLRLHSNEALRYVITDEGGDHAVAIYIKKILAKAGQISPPLTTPEGSKDGQAPELLALYAAPDGEPKRVYEDRMLDVYELPHPRPYFETQGGRCDITALGRDKLRAVCASPATLVRRELFFPTWTADINGHSQGVLKSGEIFQAVSLPEGQADVTFSYAPGKITSAYVAFGAGTVGLLWAILLEMAEGSGSFLKKRTKKLLRP